MFNKLFEVEDAEVDDTIEESDDEMSKVLED
jgi:hypothetical protein